MTVEKNTSSWQIHRVHDENDGYITSLDYYSTNINGGKRTEDYSTIKRRSQNNRHLFSSAFVNRIAGEKKGGERGKMCYSFLVPLMHSQNMLSCDVVNWNFPEVKVRPNRRLGSKLRRPRQVCEIGIVNSYSVTFSGARQVKTGKAVLENGNYLVVKDVNASRLKDEALIEQILATIKGDFNGHRPTSCRNL